MRAVVARIAPDGPIADYPAIAATDRKLTCAHNSNASRAERSEQADRYQHKEVSVDWSGRTVRAGGFKTRPLPVSPLKTEYLRHPAAGAGYGQAHGWLAGAPQADCCSPSVG